MGSSARSSRSCSARPPASARCSRSAGATSTSPARCRRSASPGRSSAAMASRRSGRTIRRPRSRDASSRCPTFTAEAVRRRLAVTRDLDPESLVFHSREGTPLTTANVRRQLRQVLERAGISGVTPHMFRRTVATAVNNNAERRTRRGAARPHRHEDHGAALHPAPRAGEPGHRGAAGPGVRRDED